MAKRVVLHIGTMKSGTSYLQSLLMGNDPVLRESGYAYLGRTFARQAKAVRGVLSRAPKRGQLRRWAALAQEARELDGDAGLVSMEFLSFASAEQADLLLAALDGLEIEVVLTVRDQFRAVPAQWQTFTRNLGTKDWPGYLRAIRAAVPPPRGARAHATFHRAQDVVSMIERWGGHPAVDRLHVVTVPPPSADRTELWHRFRAAAGLPELQVDLEDLHDNPSLGYASCDYLRRVNAMLTDVPAKRYREVMRPLTRDVLGPLRSEEGTPQLDLTTAAYVRTRNQAIRDRVGADDFAGEGERDGDGGSHRLIGSATELPVPAELTGFPRAPGVPLDQEVARAATAVIAACRARSDAPEGADAQPIPGPIPGLIPGPGPGPGSADLAALVAESGRLLRLVNRWGR